ncbi:hypothetical protein N7492_004683 [Penicillium capsulatum]|uniref:BAG domain-containing protein n=1 Tax=Penicillium capsulatum TaxID=69766 RepID=A0A9W9LR69_9EURO|nr:hypothetical protein N7492_004683 [Penicillium capsulatum]KAJ6136207.1 hypothetical protein N7512_001367 [Penicillium capsulatum]
MTLLPSPLAQSTLGEKATVYLDHVIDNLPEFLHSLRPRLDPVLSVPATSFRSVARALPFDADDQPTALCAAIFVCLLTVAAMSWGNPLSNLWRRSPNYSAAPHVSDEDFSYITPDDIVDPPSNAPRYEKSNAPRFETQYDGNADETEPDVICLRHRGTVYPLRFRAYAIDDGVLTVGDLRQEAAATTGAQSTKQIRLLYKGQLLKHDSHTCKEQGLKQHSEVLCVVSEVGANTPSDLSDAGEQRRPDSSSSRADGEPTSPHPEEGSGKKKSGRKKKGSKKGKGRTQDTLEVPPPALHRGPNAMEQVTALAGYFQQELVPLVDDYVANPPTEPKKREFEYKKLSETILAQIMLKADGIEPDGVETIRNARKALIKEAQANLNRLDEVDR